MEILLDIGKVGWATLPVIGVVWWGIFVAVSLNRIAKNTDSLRKDDDREET